MRSRLTLGLVLLAAVAVRAETLDRIAVTVGKQVITVSDVILDLRVSAFIDQKPVDLSGDQKRKAADRLVDQALILKEAVFSRVAAPSADEAAKLLEPVKLQYSGDAEYRAALGRYQITEQDLLDHLTAGLRAMRFTDLRFRPEVQVTPDEVREFYDKMAEDWRRTKSTPVPAFDASKSDMEQLLIDQRIALALDRWLGMQRTDIEILYREPAFR